MHIPDGFIPLWQCAIYWTIAIVALIFAFRWGREKLDFFHRELKRLGRKNRVRVRSLYRPFAQPVSKSVDYGP